MEGKVMNVRPFAATRGRSLAIGTTVLVAAFIVVGGQTIARAQTGRATNQHPAQGLRTPNSFSPYGLPNIGGRYWPYPVKDPTADERAAVAGRVYRAIVDEWAQRAMSTPRPARAEPDIEARSNLLQLMERLGPWSLRWQEAQDNAARSRAARYQAMSDHLGRMSALEDRRYLREAGQATGGLDGPKPPRESVEVARFFRPIDEWDIDGIVPGVLVSERPLNPQGVSVTPAEQDEIADRVYHVILDEAVDRFLASSRGGETRPGEVTIFDARLAERLGFWSDLWRQSQEVAARDPSWRPPAADDRSARFSSAGARTAGPSGRTDAMRLHIERMSELESGRFVDDAIKRAGRSTAQPMDMTRFRDFAEVVRFFRIEAESPQPGASRPKGTDVTDSGQAATAARIYRAILDEAARRYREAPRAGEALADVRLVFDSRLAERLAAWSIRWARSQIRTDLSRVAQFNTVRSHVERMARLEDGRSFHDTLERAGSHVGGVAAPGPPSEFADVARFFRLEALWELEQVRSR
jgi:hypothetical protein